MYPTSPPPLTQTVLQKRQGSSVIYKFQDHTLWDGGGLVGYMPYVTKHPGTTTKVLEALNDAAKLWTTSPSQAEAVIEKEANSTPTQAQESYQAIGKKGANLLTFDGVSSSTG